jgi:hypothetical protein
MPGCAIFFHSGVQFSLFILAPHLESNSPPQSARRSLPTLPSSDGDIPCALYSMQLALPLPQDPNLLGFLPAMVVASASLIVLLYRTVGTGRSSSGCRVIYKYFRVPNHKTLIYYPRWHLKKIHQIQRCLHRISGFPILHWFDDRVFRMLSKQHAIACL